MSCETVDSIESISIAQQESSPPPAHCAGFNYGDSVFFIDGTLINKIVNTSSVLAGKFGATPEGLSIDSLTGAIDVNLSDAGLKYEVYYVATGGTDTCKTNVIISGIDYLSSINVLSENDTLISPVYNSQVGLGLPGDDDDDDDDEDDDDDDEQNEFDLSGSAQLLGVAIDTVTGAINLQQTVDNGTFGVTPVSGTSQSVTIQYKLDDDSDRSLNSINVTVYYYDKLTDVPQSLLDEVTNKNNSLNTSVYTSARVSALARRPRPPAIIIVNTTR
ncbi:MAG: hypothetical protein AAFQ94_26505 [Bacteroidota bacterium]